MQQPWVSLANHAHVFPAEINPQGTIPRLLEYLDACDIARAICFAPFVEQAPNLQRNRWLAAEIKSQDRLFGFGTIDFKQPNLADQVKEIVDLGLKGIKINPPVQKLVILSGQAKQVYAAAERAGLFITFHTGIHHHRISEALVYQWDDIAYDFPKLRFSMEHVGGWSFFNEAVAVIANHVPPPWDKSPCLVFAGLTSIFSQDQLPFWFMPAERLQELVRQAGVRQLIFGLDFPYNDIAATQRGIDTIASLGLSEADVALILGGNLARELGL